MTAEARDAAEILVLQLCCWVEEAKANDTLNIPALHENLEDVSQWIASWQVWTVRLEGRLVGAVRAHQGGDRWQIGRLMVAPDLAGRGLGRWLLQLVERQAPPRGVCVRAVHREQQRAQSPHVPVRRLRTR